MKVEWCVVNFKYEKLGVFCFVCGIMGHMENKCPVRFSMENDDGTRGWNGEIRAEARRSGGRLTSRWLKDERGGGATATGNQPEPAHGDMATPSTGPTTVDMAALNLSIQPAPPHQSHTASNTNIPTCLPNNSQGPTQSALSAINQLNLQNLNLQPSNQSFNALLSAIMALSPYNHVQPPHEIHNPPNPSLTTTSNPHHQQLLSNHYNTIMTQSVTPINSNLNTHQIPINSTNQFTFNSHIPNCPTHSSINHQVSKTVKPNQSYEPNRPNLSRTEPALPYPT
jgi:hypothetical protein